MYEFLICLHCDSLEQGKRGVNEREIRETSECLSFQAFLSVCFSHVLFSTLDASFFFTFFFKSVCTMTCLLYTSPSPRDLSTSRMPSSA